jgi:proteasome lid subunit RPN8/RPN11
MKLPKEFVDEMVAHAQADAPIECCGLIAGEAGDARKLFRTGNSEKSPYRYRVHDQDLINFLKLIDKSNWDFFATYHSHTASEAYPSPTDVRLAEHWPDPFYIVISVKDKNEPVVRAFRIEGEEITEEPIEIDPEWVTPLDSNPELRTD